VYFKGDVLEQVDSDVLPSESDFAGRLVGPKAAGKLPALQASEEDLKKFAPAATATRTDAPAAPAALPRSYPPLEPAVR
jgi:outer membrane protein assembly factor BamE